MKSPGFHPCCRAMATTLALLIMLHAPTASAVIDDAATQGVWKAKYGVTAVQMADANWLAADADGDGLSNAAEIGAGTNPFLAGSVVRVTLITATATHVSLTFPSVTGKQYVLQGSETLSGFAALNPPVSGPGTGSLMTLTGEKDSFKFFRVLVQDIDTDGDGLSNWVELETGLNPNSLTPAEGAEEHAFVTAQIALPHEVNIMASETFASEDGPTAGTFTITRTQKLVPLTVSLTRSGTAVLGIGPGDDFSVVPGTALPGSVDFVSGVDSVEIIVNPNSAQTATVEGSESVTATLVAPGGAQPPFTLGANSSATVIIGDSTTAAGTGLLARYYDTASTNYVDAANFGQSGTFTYTRVGSSPYTASTIVIPFTYNGSPALQVGNLVKLTFTSGGLNNTTYNHLNYTVTAVNAGVNFTVGISGAGLPASYNPAGSFSIQSFPHPAVIERVDATVNNDWQYGTPNGVTISPSNSADNYSATWDAYLAPTTAGSYVFQLDADDKARVLLDTGSGLVEILEHGWDGATTPETVGTFKQSATFVLAVPATPAQRYKIRVEHVETTNDARCRLQWSVNGAAFVNIPQANQFTHTQAMSYNYTRSGISPSYTGTIVVTPVGGHSFTGGEVVTLSFSTGNLFTPGAATTFNGDYTITAVNATTYTVGGLAGATLPATGTGNGFVLNNTGSTTTGLFNLCYSNTTFSNSPARVGVDVAVTTGNNGIWNTGTPDLALIQLDTFTARWTGQVQPQFSEEYTFVVQADDGCALWINGQPQVLKMSPAASTGGSTYSYDAATGNTVINYAGLAVQANSYVVGEIVRLDPSSGNLSHAPTTSPTYSYDSVTGLAVIDYTNLSNVTPGGFVIGETIELDPITGNLSTLATTPYAITAATVSTFTVNIGIGLFVTGTGNITIADTRNAVITAVTATTFTVGFGAGKYTNGSTGNVNVDIVNKPLKDWSSNGNERFVRIPVIGGTRYDIQLDYYENTSAARCMLSWFSPSQTKQIIPTERLYPSNGVTAPAAHTSATDATALVGGPFSYTVGGSNGGGVSVTGLPPGLTFSGGVISGSPTVAGDYQIIITITNAAGTSTSVLNLHVEDTDGTVSREVWTGEIGITIANIPTGTTPDITTTLSTLEAPADYGDDYGQRIRGYITAPKTGNYYFWIAASNAAELWISNDDEPVSAFKRAWVTTGNTTPQTWTGEANQKSPWMALEQGHRYYIEILHKAGVGSGDNLAVGWSTPGEATTAPSQVVPGYVLSPYVAPPPGSTPGTLYVATMLAQGGAVTSGVGSSTLRLSEDENSAIMNYAYSNLTGPITSQHIHTDPYLSKPSTIVFDIDTPVTPGDGLQPDGSYKWTILAVGTLTKADIIEIIKQGKAYINLHTALYPGGEIRGNYTLANGTRTFTPPPAPPSWTDDSNTDVGAVRFLTQATFGPNIADITALKAIVPPGGQTRYEKWIDDQFLIAASQQLPEVLRTENASAQGGAFEETLTFNAWWWNAISAPDQLRQRFAFALSEIHVVSAQGPLDNRAEALSFFYDKLADNAFGNFRDILETTTKTWTMGRYLDMWRNDKPDLSIGRSPNENYAREIKQLFSVGLYRMWPDGTLILTSEDSPIDTYTQREIVGFAHAFTGWDYGYTGAYRTALNAPTNTTALMREVPARHFTGTKRVLNNEVLPGLPTLGNQPLDPYATHNSSHYDQPAYQALAEQELDSTHDQLFNHPNVGPFICRQLIQRMVTSHPSRDYLYRVVQKFNDNGSGVRGDMKAVIKAILLDYEARSTTETTKPAYGKQREPVLRVATAARAFRPTTFSGTYVQTAAGGRTITVTTATPHKLVSGNSVFLDFTSGSPAPWIGAYTIASPATNTFTVTAQGWASGTYSQTAGSNVMTITITSHWLGAGQQAYYDFTSGTAHGLAGLDNLVHTAVTSTSTDTVAGTTFTITAPDTIARSGNVMIPRFNPGSFTTASSGLAAPDDRRLTMDTNTDHHLNVGDLVQLNFFTGANPLPADLVVTVESIVDLNTYTALAPSAGTNLGTNQGNNSVYQFPLLSQPLVRNGNVNNRTSTFNMGNTDADIDQSPINSATVFNFYLPDYKFPGTLASQGITTPEFQETAETSVIRQANFLFSGIYYPTNNLSLASFKTGTNALVMDLSQWIGNAADGGLGAGDVITEPWTDDTNLDKLIDKLSTLLMADQLSASAKAVIQNHVLTLKRGFQISSLTNNSPTSTYTQVNTPVTHGLTNGTSVTLSGITGGTFTGSINGTHTISNVGTTSFRVPIPYLDATLPTPISVTNGRISTTLPYDNAGSAPDADKRDRLNAIIQLILTSPDFTIQR